MKQSNSLTSRIAVLWTTVGVGIATVTGVASAEAAGLHKKMSVTDSDKNGCYTAKRGFHYEGFYMDREIDGDGAAWFTTPKADYRGVNDPAVNDRSPKELCWRIGASKTRDGKSSTVRADLYSNIVRDAKKR